MDVQVSAPPESEHVPYVPHGWSPIAWWVLTTLSSLALGLLAASIIGFLGLFLLKVGALLIAIVLGGAVVGGVQPLFLNKQRTVVSGDTWVLVSVIGCSLAIGAVSLVGWGMAQLPFGASSAVPMVVFYSIGPICGVVLGTSQWLVLRRRLHRAGSWVLATAISSSILWIIVPFLLSAVFGGSGG